MTGGIFVLHDDGTLDKLDEQPYDAEDRLQELLAKYPNLLAGDQMDLEKPREWLLVSREIAVPGEEDGAGRWSLDHLFLDQDAIPTLVEVKRSSDTRIRREVVGQMLDYAANAVAYWPVETIRSKFEKTCELQGRDPVSSLSTFLRDPSGIEPFWQNVKTNLQAGKIRLVFVADEIPQELRRVVEFLNGQMDPAEVLAIEVKQYVGQKKLKTLVPRLIGQTATAQQRKTGPKARQEKIDQTTFLNDMRQARGAEECRVSEEFIQWAVAKKMTLNFNRWSQSSSFIPILEVNGQKRYPISVSTGKVGIQMQYFRDFAPFNEEAKRTELWRKLNAVPGVPPIPPERMTGFPSVPLKSLVNNDAMRAFIDALDWMVNEVRQAGQ